jgi:HlyD family secretion protein
VTSLIPLSARPSWLAGGDDDDPRLEIGVGLLIAFAFFVILLGWAALVPLDAAAYAPGQVAVATHRQTLQHREGGVIRAIDVKDGQYVHAGDVLIELVGADVLAAQRALTSQVVGLKAQRARLLAEQAGSGSITWPPEFKTAAGDDADEAQKAITVQEAEFHSRADALASHKAVLRQRMAELSDQIDGYQRQIEAARDQERLIADELKDVSSLSAQGYAPISQVRALQRSQAELVGRLGEYAAQIAQARQQSGELELQILQLDADEREQVSKDLRDAEFQLNDLLPRLNAAEDQARRIQVRAPVSGTVMGLSVFTIGGVVAPGERLMDLVPDKSQLLIQAQIAPQDIEGLRVGQTTEVRLGAERDRTLPILKGVLTELSADSLLNEKTGASYFAAEVTIPPDQLALLQAANVKNFQLRPGLPAQVIVPTAKRTALQFLLEPLNKTLWRSFRER